MRTSANEARSDSPTRGTTRAWPMLDAARVAEALATSLARGLATAEAAHRLTRHGPNRIASAPRRGRASILLSQFRDVMVLVLVASAIVAGFVGELQDTIAIVAIVVLNGLLGFVQEYRADRAMGALAAMAAPNARVRRDGTPATIPAADLVPGDVVLLESGNVVPADLRLVEASRLAVDEAALTGESVPVEKVAHPLDRDDLPLADRRNMAFRGTVVSAGRGAGIAVATGMHTELGRIATLLRDATATRTPLQRRLARFGRNIAIVVVGLCAVILLAGMLRGEPPILMFMTALSLAVAALPEALPAVVTVSLALGARKMARHHALIRRLPAVETLGAVTCICSDKTGTLTRNRMRVEVIEYAGDDDASRRLLLEALALCTDVAPAADGTLVGDPTETALHHAAAEAGHLKEALVASMPRVAELPFSPERARMTTLHHRNGALVAFTKGAPERVLPACDRRVDGEGDVDAPLDRDAELARAGLLASSGLRVLAVAMRRLRAVPPRLEDVECGQTFLGLVGLLDPPRAGVRDAVALCQSAGIRVVMITGDHPATARTIAERLGIAPRGTAVVTGQALAAMSDRTLDERVLETRVYARVAPEDKIRIVQALQRHGESVAMTGDGVNDAPALRSADIGVAMGRSGTDVAREAAHMVLLDDDFATIVGAVREGRRIYDNIRRFVRFALSTNAGEIWTLFLAPFVGLPLPLLPIHMLWMNLVTDGLPGLALAAEPAERNAMTRPPRPPSESIFAHGLWQHAVWVGLLMAGLTLGTQAWAIHVGDAHWQSMAFTVLTLSQVAHVLAVRSEHESTFRLGLMSNRPLLGAVLLTAGLQLATLYVPALRSVFRTTALSLVELLACVGIASLVFVAVELEKWMIRRGWLYLEPTGPLRRSR
jgi:Ca2+-transporting ATPase